MPHPRIDDRHELPEYPVRGASARRRPTTVWERYPLGSRIGAVLVAALVLGGGISLVRHDASESAAAGELTVDASGETVDGGLATDDASLAEASLPSDAPTVTTAAFVEGTLPLREGTLPATIATAPPATAAQRNAAPATTRPAVVKPAATTAAKKATATTAKAVAKPAATTAAPKATTAATQPKTAIVKPPTTATTPKTTPATTAPKTTYTADEVVALIRQTWPADSVDKALEVAYRESRYRHTAYNGWCCYGVFQINASSHMARLRARGLGVEGLFDPHVNIEIALEIYQSSGWGPWGG